MWSRIEATGRLHIRWAAEELRRWSGSCSDWTGSHRPVRMGLVRRFPYGPVLGIARSTSHFRTWWRARSAPTRRGRRAGDHQTGSCKYR